MLRMAAIAALGLMMSAAPALAQDARPSDRYEVCQAPDGADERFDDLCELVDELHSRIEDARGQYRSLAQLRGILSSTLIVIANHSDEAAYRDAIEVARTAQEFYDTQRFPSRWASMQQNIGTSLLSIGETDAAIEALSAGIATLDRAAQPPLYATLQQRLGDAYFAKSAGEDRHMLTQALTAYQTALVIVRRPSLEERRSELEASIAAVERLLAATPDPA
jgi:tetratricopeptide (TPR) repeat protein